MQIPSLALHRDAGIAPRDGPIGLHADSGTALNQPVHELQQVRKGRLAEP